MARLVLGAVGAVAGFLIGGPVGALQGFTIGYAVGGLFDPNQKVLGPKLSDLKTPTASYGSPIPYIEGAPRLAGVIIWASDKRPIANTTSSGGKGGPGVDSTTFTYEMDALYELAINECEAVSRIWSNGKLVWSNRDDADTDTLGASANTTSWRDIRFHDGNSAQLPDPTYEAAVGVGNAPAYRGRTTMMVEGLNLGGSGQLPVLTFEVLSEASASYAAQDFSTLAGIAYAPASGISTFSLTGPSYIFAADDFNSLSGFVNSFFVYSIAALGEPPVLYNTVDIGFQEHDHITLLGNSDEDLYILNTRPGLAPVTGLLDAYTIDGGVVQFDMSVVVGDPISFSKLGNDIVFAPNGPSVVAAPGADGKLRRFNRATGALAVTSASALAQNVQSVAIGGAYVYGLSYDGSAVYKCNLATLALVDTYAIPAIWNAGIAGGYVMCDGDDVYVLGVGSSSWNPAFIHWDGSAWEIVAYGQNLGLPHAPDPVPSLIDIYSAPSAYGAATVVNGVLFGRTVGADYGIKYLSNTVGIVLPTLDQVVRRLCLRTGLLTDDDIDVTDLSHDVAIADGFVRGMAISQVSTTRVTLEMLMQAYLFEAVEGDVIRFVRRGGASAVTIPYTDLGAGQDGEAEPIPLKRVNDIEIAARVSVKYANTLNDFQDGLEQADRLVTESTSEQTVEIALGFEPSEAKKLADANTLDLAVSLIGLGPVSLTRKYSYLEPTDVVTLVDQYGDQFRCRIVKQTIGDGINALDLVLDDATTINSAAETDDSYSSSTLIRLVADTVLYLLDIPILRDADNGPGFYAAFGATGAWPGAELDSSLDDVTYDKLLDVADRAVLGTATSVLGDFTGGIVFDEVNTLTVNVGDGTLASTTRDLMLTTDVNALVVGAEIIKFRTASLVSPGVYELSGFERGLRGTEWAKPGHAANEHVVLLQTTGMRRVVDQAADLNVSKFWKAVTHGKSKADAISQVFADTGVGLKPFAPVDLHIEEIDSGSVLKWNRRSRLSTQFLGLVAVPLGEASESYDVEVLDSGAVLVSSGTVSAPSYALSTLTGGEFLNAPMWGIREISSEFVGVREDQAGSISSAKRIVKVAADGSFVAQSDIIGQQVFQMDNIGDEIYVSTSTISSGFTLSSQVYKLTRTSLGTIDATYTTSLGAEPAGLVADGTDVWIVERANDLLRKLDPSTLASVATYAMATSPTGMFHTAGKLWICCWGSDEIARFDIGTLAEDLRFSVVHRPMDVLVIGSLVFVTGESRIGVYSTAGAAVIEHDLQLVISGQSQRALVAFGGQVAGTVYSPGSPYTKIALFDAATGHRDALMASPSPFAFLAWAGGSDGADLIITGSRSIAGGSLETRRFTVAAGGLTGYTLTVWQNSAVVGRGYPATLEL
jgi:hypothetical protein